MNAATQTPTSRRNNERVIFNKTALAIFDGEPQALVKTIDISVSGIGVHSPVQGLPKSTCWVRLKIPVSHHQNKVFDVKTTVIYSVYSKDKHNFKTGLVFVNPPAPLIELIKKIIHSKHQ